MVILGNFGQMSQRLTLKESLFESPPRIFGTNY